jgi:L-ascorbate metabolism protein UlaG (beta-lactamase superfamily)
VASVAWLGTAGLYVEGDRESILIDPFVTRPGLLRVGLGMPLAPDEGLVDRWIHRLAMRDVRYVLVTHAHYDHVLDAPAFARKLGASLVGSSSVLNVARGYGLPEASLIAASPALRLVAGSVRIRTLPSRHGRALLGRVPYPGHIGSPLRVPVPASAYRAGDVFSIHVETPGGSFVSHASAAIEPGMFDGLRADTVFLALAGRTDTAEYLREVPVALGARRIVLTHFDHFFRPLGGKLPDLPFVRRAEFIATARRLFPGIDVDTLPLGRVVSLF